MIASDLEIPSFRKTRSASALSLGSVRALIVAVFILFPSPVFLSILYPMRGTRSRAGYKMNNHSAPGTDGGPVNTVSPAFFVPPGKLRYHAFPGKSNSHAFSIFYGNPSKEMGCEVSRVQVKSPHAFSV